MMGLRAPWWLAASPLNPKLVPNLFVKITITGFIRSPTGWRPWCADAWCPEDRLGHVAHSIHGLSKATIRLHRKQP